MDIIVKKRNKSVESNQEKKQAPGPENCSKPNAWTELWSSSQCHLESIICSVCTRFCSKRLHHSIKPVKVFHLEDFTHVCVCASTCVCVNVCMWMCVYICVQSWIYMFVCMYIYMIMHRIWKWAPCMWSLECMHIVDKNMATSKTPIPQTYWNGNVFPGSGSGK